MASSFSEGVTFGSSINRASDTGLLCEENFGNVPPELL